jgi:hypothetical protein
MSTDHFYRVQLGGLGLVCLSSILLERYVARKKEQSANASSSREQRRRSPVGERGDNRPWKEATADSGVLARKYLLVYAVVMGERHSDFDTLMAVELSFCLEVPIGFRDHMSIVCCSVVLVRSAIIT